MRFALSLAEQGFGSLLTFAVNLWLIRNGAASAYGAYVFWLSVAFVGGVVEGTLVLAHLSRLPSARDRMAERRDPERFMLTVTLGVLTAVTLAVGVGRAICWHRPGPTWRRRRRSCSSRPSCCSSMCGRSRSRASARRLAAALSAGIFWSPSVALWLDYALGNKPDAGRVLLLTGLSFGGVSPCGWCCC